MKHTECWHVATLISADKQKETNCTHATSAWFRRLREIRANFKEFTLVRSLLESLEGLGN